MLEFKKALHKARNRAVKARIATSDYRLAQCKCARPDEPVEEKALLIQVKILPRGKPAHDLAQRGDVVLRLAHGFPPCQAPRREKLGNHFKQFVTAFETDTQKMPHLAFGVIDRAITPASIAPWKVDLGYGVQITTFNPVAHTLCYFLRVPSGLKKKDKEPFSDGTRSYSKISLLEGLALQTIDEGMLEGVDYADMHKEWFAYIETLLKRPDPLTKLKGIIMRIYWDTIGTEVSHGKGAFVKLSRHSDAFSGSS